MHEYASKLALSSTNAPSGGDIINLLKYFQNSLFSISKDIDELQIERFSSRSKDQEWRSIHIPQLQYSELYLSILHIAENVRKLTNQPAVSEHLLRTLHNLLIFLDYECLEGTPLALAWMLTYFPTSVHSNIMELMCSVVIPLVYNGKDDQESYAIDSVPSILTLVFQHVEKIEYHVWVMESFLCKKKGLYKDLLLIIAYGLTEARLPAVCLLFHYWPEMYPTMFHQNQTLRPLHYTWEPWKPLTCDRTDCPNKAGKVTAMKMTVNPKISAQHGGRPPPLYICLDCADALSRQNFDQLVDILLPTKPFSLTCESKTCRSRNTHATVTCWSPKCTFLTGNRAIRFCDSCHMLRHGDGQATGQDREDESQTMGETGRNLTDVETAETVGQHVYQMQLPELWDMTLDVQASMVEAVVSLTRETVPRWRQALFGTTDGPDEPVVRSVVGLTCTAANSPGGPPTSGDLMMMSVNPTPTSAGLGLGSSSASGLVPSGSIGGPLTGSPSNLGVPSHTETSSPSIRGIAGMPPTTMNVSGESGGLPLTGRYSNEDHKVLAVYGALLVGEKCRPRESLNVELLTRITAGIFNWYLDTIYTSEAGSSYDGRGTLRQRYELGDLLEKVKSEYILKWIQEVQRLHPEAIFAVLLPHPLDYARVGNSWDALCDRTTQVKHGLSRIGSLIPYDIVTFEVWDFVMPYWLESIRTEVSRTDYFELEVLLKKIFDATAGPFPFLPQKVYHFAAESFINTPAAVQDQALAWLEILTTVEVPIPMKELLTMFRNGVESFQTELLMPDSHNYENDQGPPDENINVNHVQGGMRQSQQVADASVVQHTYEVGDDNRTGDCRPVDTIPHDEKMARPFRLPSQIQSDDEQTHDDTKGLLSGKSGRLSKKLTKKSLKSVSNRDGDGTDGLPEDYQVCTHTDENVVEGDVTQAHSSPKTDGSQSHPPQEKNTTRLATQRSKQRKDAISDYRATECLTQMLNIAYRQLKIHDPLGHAKITQETPQLLLGLLAEMLQVYWGYDGSTPQKGLRTMYCEGLESCIFPPAKEATFLGASQEEENNNGSECTHCLDILSLLNYANLICQHLTPVRPSPKTSVDFTPEALTRATEIPEYKDWRSPNTDDTEEKAFPSSQNLPDSSYVNTMPPLLRFVYLLVRFISTPNSSFTSNESESTRSVTEPRCTHDPIALQCILECLVYLCHLGDGLQNAITHAEKGLVTSTAGSTLSGSGEQPIPAGFRGYSPARSPNPVAVVSQVTGGSGSKECTATPQAQLNFIFYLIHCHLIPSLWNMLKSELSQVSSWIVPLLLHCVNFPGGSKVLWRLIETEFAHSDWRVRFDALEKAAVMLRELDFQVLHRGFGGAAGIKIANILSGGNTASASGVNLFARNASGVPVRARTTGGRINAAKGNVAFNRVHGGGVTNSETKIGSSSSTNENPFIQTAVAHALCRLIESLDDHNPMIAQSAAKHLASMNNTALACGVQCLEFQFDTVVADRCLILQRMHQLSCALPNRQVFTWEFFVNRFGLLALQAQLNAAGQQEIDTVTDLNGYHRNSQHFQTQFERACFASSACAALRTISQPDYVLNSQMKTFSSISVSQNQLFHPTSLQSVHSESTSLSHEFIPSATTQDLPADIHSGAEFMDTSNKILSNIRSTLEQNNRERDTLHQWVRLLLKFMASVQCDHRLDDGTGFGVPENNIGTNDTGSGFADEVKSSESASGGRHHANVSSKDEIRDRRGLRRAERHIAFLLGYADGTFTIPPHRMRNSTAFRAFVAEVSGVLDRNFSMGVTILHQTLAVLQFCASPQRYATDAQPPTFTLRLLDPQMRIHWLRTLSVILYKYEYSDPGGYTSNSFTRTVGTGTMHHISPLNHTSLVTGSSASDGVNGQIRLRKTSSEANLLDQGEPSRSICDGGGFVGGHSVLGISISGGYGDGGATVPNFSGAPTSASTNGHNLTGVHGSGSLPCGGVRGIVEYLIKIVLNTLDAQVHVCRQRTEDEPCEPPSPPIRLRSHPGASNVSGDFNAIVEKDTPPASPSKLSHEEEDDVVMPGVTLTLAKLDSLDEGEQGQNDDFDSNDGTRCLGDIGDPHSTKIHDTENVQRQLDRLPSEKPRFATQRQKSSWKNDIAASTDTFGYEGAKSVRKQIRGIHTTVTTEVSDPVNHFIPATVSMYEQAILAPILNDGVEMIPAHEGSSTPNTSKLHSLVSVPPHTSSDKNASKTGRKIPLQFHKYSSVNAQENGNADSMDTKFVSAGPSPSLLDPLFISAAATTSGTDKCQLEPGKELSHVESGDILRKLPRPGQMTGSAVESDTATSGLNVCKPDKKKSISHKGNVSPQPNSQPTASATVAALATAALDTERCAWCNQVLERYDESTLGLGVICLATFVHREPSLAAPFLRDMLLTVARLANASLYSWQPTSPHMIVPGNVSSIARQFLRCTMYNLAPNGLFLQLFQTVIPDEQFFKCIISVLVDFEEHMSFFQPITLVLEPLNKRKTLPTDSLPTLLENLANYLAYLPNLTDDAKINHFIANGWTEIIGPLEVFLRKLVCVNMVPVNLDTSVRIMTYILRSPVASNFKTLSDTFAALLRLIVGNVAFNLPGVIELCSLSNRTLKERTKTQLSKTLVEMFLQYIKFRISLPDENLMKLLQFILMDAGGTAEPNQVVEGLTSLFNPQTYHLFSTGAAEIMRPHLSDCIAFISDVHTMHKVKQAQKSAVQLSVNNYGVTTSSGPNIINTSVNPKLSSNLNTAGGSHGTPSSFIGSGISPSTHGGFNVGSQPGGFSSAIGLTTTIPSLHEDVLGAHLKSGIAQYVSLELSRSSSCNDQDVLSILAPGLLSDIRPIKSTGFVTNNALPRSKTATTYTGPSVSSSGTSTSHQGTEVHPARVTRPSGSITSKKSDDSGGADKSAQRNADTTVILITPSADTSESSFGITEAETSRAVAGSFSVSTSTPAGLSPRATSSNSSIISSQSVGHSAMISSVMDNLTLPPGAPSTSSSRMGIYNHLTLAPTPAQTSQMDIPVLHLLPWLKSIPPSSQLGPRDFLIMVERVRTLSWLLLGATMNMALTREATGLACRPIPFVLVRAVADLVKALLSSFPEQQKQSVTVMSSLYHVFLLCQLWTVYCEAAASLAPLHSTQHKVAIATSIDFWTRIMPTVLRLLSISEDFIVVTGRLLSVIEELLECQCSTVIKFIPIWIPMLCGRQRQLPGNMLKRLQKIIEWAPPEPYTRMLLLLSIPDTNDKSQDNKINGQQPESEQETTEQIPSHTPSPSLPSTMSSSLLACPANALMGCNPVQKISRKFPEEGFTTSTHCAGHALASSAPYANGGIGTGIGIGAGALGADLLTSRLVAWLKKHIFVLGRNEDQHSTATHIFVH